jgi:cytochrome c
MPGNRRFVVCAVVSGLMLPAGLAAAQLQGHGGPVRGDAVSSDGATALSGSFDSAAILWDLRHDTAVQVLRFHDSAVNSVALLQDGRAVTAGADARIATWTPGRIEPDAILAGHTAPVAALAVSPDGSTLASASWDHTVRLWRLAGGAPVVLEGHAQNVNGVAFMPDGTAVVSAGYDATVRIWPLPQPSAPIVVALAAPLNALAVAPDGEIAAGGADGKVHLLSPAGAPRGAVEASATPVIALAFSRDGARIAAAGINGAVAIIDRKTRSVMRTLVGPGMPVWSVAFLPDGRTLLTGGADRVIRRWDVATGQPIDPIAAGETFDPLAAYAGDPGAQLFRACVACHTLSPAESDRAGPSLHGLFGRHIASLPGYNYSAALQHLDIVWTPETVAKLFEVGPARYTPGTKMPEQRISAPEDRTALVKFLERATK